MRTRRSRTRTRKTELLSLLRLDHSTSAANMGNRARQHQQLKLFPLHPETANDSAEDTKGPHDYDENVNVSLLFSGDNTSATTLSGLLSDGEATIPVTAAAVVCSEEGSIGSHGSEFDEGDHQHRSSLLVWAAMKSRARDKEEKWVSYSELVERKPTPDLEPEEVSSCAAAFNGADDGRLGSSSWQPKGQAGRLTRQLLLKLDYEEVLSSWCDKGSLFINDNDGHLHQLHHEAAQTVPEINDEFLGPESAIDTGLSDRWGRASLWTVPDQKGVDINSTMEEKGGRFRRREASILRYKEKRQNRLFTKQIRYDVRRLNAEKRPRIKGRFVRRSCKDD